MNKYNIFFMIDLNMFNFYINYKYKLKYFKWLFIYVTSILFLSEVEHVLLI